jgi:hypothetical protein
MQLSRAYNNSIYLMVGVPYLMLGMVGFMVYRHLRVRAANESLSIRAAGLPRIESEPGLR